ncbi:dienelactone hydrolase family protein [Mobilicoccus pelagius]|uniref:Dienelactone hydrolase domain-containing protein n=1 Tax=Mobilicoccus pelagius NBRC 104925 TaxID=1089455 RepID=H5UW43_9MICO|nr:dienelactone hydrolase family protein [Mobilicoccus pelagius]GAB49951.1 hypothetical protein MOPEL_135_01890 [Mobilicoccus pelagius NBRC 104925]
MSRVLRREPLERAIHTLRRGRRPVEAVVVTLHGGPERGFRRTAAWNAAYLRLLPFGRRIRELSGDRIAIVHVRHTQTGWNGGEQTTLGQARILLADLARREPELPVGLLGHSLGGRTALAAAGHSQVTSVAALAPWVTPHDAVDHLVGRDVLVVQGNRDLICPKHKTDAFVDRLRDAGGDVDYEILAGCGHGMYRRASQWHDLAAHHLVRTLLPEG